MDAEGYATIDEFMAAPLPLHEPVCIVADVRLPQTSGLHLPEWLHRQGRNIPVVFVTAQDSAETRSAARKAGAAACFRKPVDDQALLDAIAWAAHKET
jgi:FixJ family two-component response regulator